jgi:hypothetical protein
MSDAVPLMRPPWLGSRVKQGDDAREKDQHPVDWERVPGRRVDRNVGS